MKSPIALAGAALLIGTSAAAQQPPAPSSPPAAPPAALTSVLGEYARDRGRYLVAEYRGQLRLYSTWYLPASLRLESSRFSSTNGEKTLTWHDVVYRHQAVGPEAGGQLKITPVHPVPQLIQDALRATPPVQAPGLKAPDLVELVTLDSSIHLDIRYATTNNFAGTVFYSQARAFLQRPAAEALLRAHRWLLQRGYGLLIHDGYRPWYVTKTFWDAVPDSVHWLVANPAQGSRHNRGSAVDLTLYDLSTGRPVEMPGTYDEATRRSFPNYPGGTTRQRWFRALLRTAMEAQGFSANPEEWWHFDYKDWRQYPLLNLPFEQL
ncbi:MAG: M15 family metallopeptidase [Gemmatimonadota bacterium]